MAFEILYISRHSNGDINSFLAFDFIVGVLPDFGGLWLPKKILPHTMVAASSVVVYSAPTERMMLILALFFFLGE